jgi:hypothetical protein
VGQRADHDSLRNGLEIDGHYRGSRVRQLRDRFDEMTHEGGAALPSFHFEEHSHNQHFVSRRGIVGGVHEVNLQLRVLAIDGVLRQCVHVELLELVHDILVGESGINV